MIGGRVARQAPESKPPPDDRQRVLSHIEKHGALGSAEVAKALPLSGSTTLRLLRGLCAEGLLERHGSGRVTLLPTRRALTLVVGAIPSTTAASNGTTWSSTSWLRVSAVSGG